MTIPAGVIGFAVILWGVRAETLVFAVPMAAAIEAAPWVPWRWSFSDTDFNRLCDVASVGFLLLAVYEFDAHAVRGIYNLLAWLPAVGFLVVAGQIYSTRSQIGYDSLFYTVRRAVRRGSLAAAGRVDVRKPYLVACVVAASVGNGQDPTFTVGVAMLLACLLWVNRPRRYPAAAWMAVLAVAVVVGQLGSEGVVGLRRLVGPIMMDYFRDRMWTYRDPYRNHTAIGRIGRLKQSERIVLRVAPGPGAQVPALLHEASYRTFSGRVWLAGAADFKSLPARAEGTAWKVEPDAGEPDRTGGVEMTISRYMRRGKGLLAVPAGTFRVEALPVEDVLRNALGALKVLKGPDLVEYRARYDPALSFDAAPGSIDLAVNAEVSPGIEPVAARLGLENLGAAEAVASVEAFFRDGFTYSLDLGGSARSPIRDFLLERRSGHCELYATATVMLLRAAGVPARYATGFAVNEWSPIEERFVVRRRHAHSWVRAYVDGAWRDVDTTPAVWAALESADPPWWSGAYGTLSWLWLQFSRWRWDSSQGGIGLALWLLVPLGGFLVWRLYLSERVGRGPTDKARPPPSGPGLDSEFYRVARRVEESGWRRGRGEPLCAWLERVAGRGGLPEAERVIGALLPLHERLRFHPEGLSPPDRDQLRREVDAWLDRRARDPVPAAPDP